MRASREIVYAGILLTLTSATCALAGDRISGRAGTHQTSTDAAGPKLGDRQVKPLPPIKFDPSTQRDFARSAESAKKTFTLIGRTRDGKEVRKVPGDDVIRALTGEKSSGDQRGEIDIQPDPQMEGDEAARAIVGKDNRVRVRNTDDYPYSAMGFVWTAWGGDPDDGFSCTGVLVGPRTVITSASCLYGHGFEGEKASFWNDKFEFWPAINGANDVPYGSFEYDTAYVFEGWITEYDGTYASVSAYDIGLITLSEPVGDSTGYLGYWNFGDDADDLDTNLVEYARDKEPAYTMWRSGCNISNADILETSFVHDCDVSDADAPLFVYDKSEDSRYLIGMHVATTSDHRNVAIRLYGPIFEWIDSLDGD